MTNSKQLVDVKDILIANLEKLSSSTLTGQELDDEIKRSKAMVGVSKEVTSIYNTSLHALQIQGQGKFVDTVTATEQFKLNK